MPFPRKFTSRGHDHRESSALQGSGKLTHPSSTDLPLDLKLPGCSNQRALVSR